MKTVKLGKLLRKGKACFLAYDQGMEHGPTDFDDKNVDPLYIIDIAKKGKYTGLVFQKGICEKYNKEIKSSRVPLIVKLNGKTSLVKGEPYSPILCTVKEAVKLGAKAVGYTIYLGSANEARMFSEFEGVGRDAHALGLPVIVWMYPRGASIEGKTSSELMIYSARVALELGADFVKLQHTGISSDLKQAVKAAGRTKIVIAGGIKTDEEMFLKTVKEILNTGAVGLAVGRNIWQNDKPIELSKKLMKTIWNA